MLIRRKDWPAGCITFQLNVGITLVYIVGAVFACDHYIHIIHNNQHLP